MLIIKRVDIPYREVCGSGMTMYKIVYDKLKLYRYNKHFVISGVFYRDDENMRYCYDVELPSNYLLFRDFRWNYEYRWKKIKGLLWKKF